MNKNATMLSYKLDEIKESIKKEKENDILKEFDRSLEVLKAQLNLNEEDLKKAKDVLYHTLIRPIQRIHEDYKL